MCSAVLLTERNQQQFRPHLAAAGCRMVHEQDLGEDCPVSPKKRSYPFIYWTQSTNSSPPREQRSPERSSPSPPARQIKYRSLKSDWKPCTGSSISSNYQVSCKMSPCQPIGDSYRVSARDSAKPASDLRDSDDKNKLDIQIKVTSGENINGGLTREKVRQEHLETIEEEPSEKRPRPSVELRPINEFRPNIAESIKLRERSTPQRYTDIDSADPYYYSAYQETVYAAKEKSSPSRSLNGGGSPPYNKKVNGSQNGSTRDSDRLYIEIPERREKIVVNNTGKNFSSSVSGQDKNHNKVSNTSEIQTEDTKLKINSEMQNYTRDTMIIENGVNGQSVATSNMISRVSAPVSEVRRSVNSDLDSCGSSEVDAPLTGSRNLMTRAINGSKVTLQQNCNIWTLRDRQTEKSDRNYKQICRSRKFNTRYPAPEKPRQKRAVIQDMVRPLKQWLLRHRHNPYPTKTEKIALAQGSNMTLVQVSNWFANARRRLKNVVQEQRCSWSSRLRRYNQCVQGNAELLSISSDDSIWNSDDEEPDENLDEQELEHSETGNTEEHSELDDILHGGSDHTYTRGERGGTMVTITPDSGAVSVTSVTCSTAASPVTADSSDSPAVSPAVSPVSTDTNKYKKNMMQRYLKDVTEAHETLNILPDSDNEYFPEHVSKEETVVSTDHGTWELPSHQQQPATNISISFSNPMAMVPALSTLSPPPRDDMVMVPALSTLSPPPRDDMGQGKVRELLNNGHCPTNGQYGGTPPVLALVTSSSTLSPVFSPNILRPVSVYPINLPWPTLPQFPIFVPDQNVAPTDLSPAAVGSTASSCGSGNQAALQLNVLSAPTAHAHSAGSSHRPMELDAALALSQLAAACSDPAAATGR